MCGAQACRQQADLDPTKKAGSCQLGSAVCYLHERQLGMLLQAGLARLPGSVCSRSWRFQSFGDSRQRDGVSLASVHMCHTLGVPSAAGTSIVMMQAAEGGAVQESSCSQLKATLEPVACQSNFIRYHSAERALFLRSIMGT